MKISSVKDFLLHLLLPKTCFSCKADLPWKFKNPLCPACEGLIQTPGPLICRRCGVSLKDGGAHCYQCRGSKADSFRCKIIRSAVLFTPVSRALVHAFKYSGYIQLSDYLAQRMAAEWKRYPELADTNLLVPVPLHTKKFRQRGYNQSALLARSFAQKMGMLLEEDALSRLRNTPSQTKLNRAGRLLNMRGAFVCVKPERVKGKVILLLDDVATTGATLEGCAQALKAAGAKKVMAYTFSREP